MRHAGRVTDESPAETPASDRPVEDGSGAAERPPRRGLTIALIIVVALLVVAIALGVGFALGLDRGQTPIPPPSTDTASPSPTQTSATTEPCTDSTARVTTGQPDGTAGTTHIAITLTNTGTASCSVSGAPQVVFVTAGGATVGQAAAQDASGGAEPVVLAPGGIATADLAVVDPGNLGCPASQPGSLRVTAPGLAAVTVPSDLQACTDSTPFMTVAGFVAG
jgi:hypothetical protein